MSQCHVFNVTPSLRPVPFYSVENRDCHHYNLLLKFILRNESKESFPLTDENFNLKDFPDLTVFRHELYEVR